jgi:S-adenosylmethionine hydrolase
MAEAAVSRPRAAPLVALFTDFGPGGPYAGQVQAVLLSEAPGVPVVELLADAPAHDPKAAAYLLEPLARELPSGSVLVAVVDPGVGGDRKAGVLRADGRWYVGPDNGLFELVVRRSREAAWWEIGWRPRRLTATFHGRDLFAPVAARLARGGTPEEVAHGIPRPLAAVRRPDWPDDLAEIVYIDRFGNGIAGIRAASIPPGSRVEVGGRSLARATTFSEVAPGSEFWYENSNGLLEIAVNRGRAAEFLGLKVGTELRLTKL